LTEVERLKADIMKLIRSTIAVLAILSSIALACAANAQMRGCRAPASGHWPIDPQNYVERNCAYCHGPSVQGFGVAPRLAGQHRDYLALQLDRIRTQERNNPFSLTYMSHVAVNVLPENECELAVYLSTLPPEATRDGQEALAVRGEEIFKTGVPENYVPACQFCHGPNAQGLGEFPRLGGQSYYYLKRRLSQWGEGYSKIAQHMPGIASKLSPEQIDALASYLSFLK
jgi:cytochrome c553